MGFFDKLKDAAGKGAAKAEDLAKIGKLKFEIMTLNSRIKDKKGELGEKAYSLFKEGVISEPQLKGFVDEIDNMLGQIKEKESAIEKISPEKAEESATQKNECINCGTETLLCANCKKTIKKGDAFCGNCGTKIV
jgi:hypothetical protein